MLAQAQGYIALYCSGLTAPGVQMMKAYLLNKMQNPEKNPNVFAPEDMDEPFSKRLRTMASPLRASRAPLAPRSLENDFAPPPSIHGLPELTEEDTAPPVLTAPSPAGKDAKLDDLIDGIRTLARLENKDCEAVVKEMIKNGAVMASVGCTEEQLNHALLWIQASTERDDETAYKKALAEAGITETEGDVLLEAKRKQANKQDMKPEQNRQARKRQGENSQ